jgi:hypothetical protein
MYENKVIGEIFRYEQVEGFEHYRIINQVMYVGSMILLR